MLSSDCAVLAFAGSNPDSGSACEIRRILGVDLVGVAGTGCAGAVVATAGTDVAAAGGGAVGAGAAQATRKAKHVTVAKIVRNLEVFT
jgi:hypothetical protein